MVLLELLAEEVEEAPEAVARAVLVDPEQILEPKVLEVAAVDQQPALAIRDRAVYMVAAEAEQVPQITAAQLEAVRKG
jgi:hypothetical protein